MDKKQELKEIRTKLGEYLRTERKKRKISQEKLAELCDLSTNHISKIERGCISVKFENLLKMCIALEISLDKFIMRYVEAVRPEAADYLQMLKDMPTEEERTRLMERLNIAVDDIYKSKKKES